MEDRIPVVDVFAGPGGLGEGFSGHGSKAFKVVLSVEKEANAHRTLKLRAFYHALESPENRQKFYYPLVSEQGHKTSLNKDATDLDERLAVEAAEAEALQLTLGQKEDDELLHRRVKEIADSGRPWVLVGGPPCQAYSVIGRNRNKANPKYKFEEDERIFLYKHYRKLISEFGPAVFIMENVRGLLSAKINAKARGKDRDLGIFKMIRDDLHAIRHNQSGYRLFSLTSGCADDAADPAQFLVRAENHGIPQARHRVLILGVREDILGDRIPETLCKRDRVNLRSILVGLKPIRSSISIKHPVPDNDMNWAEITRAQFSRSAKICNAAGGLTDVVEILEGLSCSEDKNLLSVTAKEYSFQTRNEDCGQHESDLPEDLRRWIFDSDMMSVENHFTHGHNPGDLARYAFVASFRQARNRSPLSEQFPEALAPKHENWESGKFKDRFYSHDPASPALTITSHIGKDGHHFIHWDPRQCRAFSVREAARIQTFPDNYVFLGGRGSQYEQVGNAVPPMLSTQIAGIIENLIQL